MLPPLFLIALSIFSGTYLVYFLYVRKYVKRSWGLEIDNNFEPRISILIPARNEEATIESKLENMKEILYPQEKMEIIVADDASEDGTVEKVKDFIKRNPGLNIKLVRQNPRAGKSAALNKALTASKNSIIIVSDADTLWSSDILRKTLLYLSDPRIGAITGRGVNMNAEDSWVTRGEDTYLQLVNLLRLGESKVHSTIRFEGGFCAYKRDVLEGFDCVTGSDDSGTALEIVQNGYRTILIPEAVFYTSFPHSFAGKFRVKVRRANQLIGLWIKCLGLLLKRRLLLPKRIAVPEIALFICNPIIFLVLIVIGGFSVIFSPLSPLGLAIMLSIVCLLVFVRRIFVEIVVDNLVLLYALITFIFKRRYVVW
jgi:cellulose synthase/poly-beta-1,6-N-acetylglucosamine synthase-like glycosyltransferase